MINTKFIAFDPLVHMKTRHFKHYAPGGPSPSFIQNWFPFPQWCYISNLVTFSSAVLLHVSSSWAVDF